MSERFEQLKQASIDWVMHGSLHASDYVGVRLGQDERGNDFVDEVIEVGSDPEPIIKAFSRDREQNPNATYVLNEPAEEEGLRWGDVYR